MTKLRVRHMKEAVASTLTYMDRLRKREIRSLRTSKETLNKALMDGVDWWRILTVAGQSGSGKSTLLSELKRDFVNLNKDQEFEILSFEFEMRMEDQVARDLSAKTGQSIKQLYSAGEIIADALYEQCVSFSKEMSEVPMFFVEEVGSHLDIRETILTFAEERGLDKNKGLVVTIDHVLLTKGKDGDAEKKKVDDLCHMFVEVKKIFSEQNVPILIIMLSQLNRDIQEKERVQNNKLHYPTQNDLFAASSVYQCSDYVLISHRPSDIVGMGTWYGPPRTAEGFPLGLPKYCPDLSGKSMIYWHIIKERFGVKTTLFMVENFAKGKIDEYKFADKI